MGETTLRQALDDYKKIYMAYRNFADRTRVEYQNDIEDLLKFSERSGIEHVSGLGLPIIQRYVAQLEEKGFASLTRKRKVVAIRSFLSFLYQDGYIDTNVSGRIILPFTDNPAPHVLTQAECERLRTSCTGSPRDTAIFELLLQTGIRLSELTHLTMSDIDFGGNREDGDQDNAFIRILGTGPRKERLIPLNSRACGALTNYLRARKAAGNPVLFLNRFGKPLGDRGVQKMLRKYVKEARLGKASIHTLRHTFAIQSLASGADLKNVQERMGHKDKRSTSIYASYAKQLTAKDPSLPLMKPR